MLTITNSVKQLKCSAAVVIRNHFLTISITCCSYVHILWTSPAFQQDSADRPHSLIPSQNHRLLLQQKTNTSKKEATLHIGKFTNNATQLTCCSDKLLNVHQLRRIHLRYYHSTVSGSSKQRHSNFLSECFLIAIKSNHNRVVNESNASTNNAVCAGTVVTFMRLDHLQAFNRVLIATASFIMISPAYTKQ